MYSVYGEHRNGGPTEQELYLEGNYRLSATLSFIFKTSGRIWREQQSYMKASWSPIHLVFSWRKLFSVQNLLTTKLYKEWKNTTLFQLHKWFRVCFLIFRMHTCMIHNLSMGLFTAYIVLHILMHKLNLYYTTSPRKINISLNKVVQTLINP